MILDDDTLASLPRLMRVVDSYDPRKPWYIGERYGYGYTGAHVHGTYDYITMGGGVILSAVAVKLRNESPDATCPSPDMFDDMMMGKVG